MILQLAFVLTAIIVGARLGGIGLGVMGGIGACHIDICIRTPTNGTSDRCYVNDCSCDFGCFMYASCRWIGLYGEVGGETFA